MSGAADVSRRYIDESEEGLHARRRLVDERWLAGWLAATTRQLRAALPPELQRELAERDEGALGEQPRTAAGPLPARTTGDAAWLAVRGEDGTNRLDAAAAATAPAAAPSSSGCTRWRWARDEALRQAATGRVCGGAVRGSGENVGGGELCARAFDGQPHTKWLDFGGKAGGAWLEYRLPSATLALAVGSWAATSAGDAPERDPRRVVLEAWVSGGSGSGNSGDSSDSSDCVGQQGWVAIDERELQFAHRHCTVASPVARLVLAHAWRLRILSVADPSAANSVQLACLDLFAAEDSGSSGSGRQERERREQLSTATLPPPPEQQQQAGANPWAALFSRNA